MEAFLNAINQYQQISLATTQALLAICQTAHFSKGSYLQRIGEIPRYIYFINRGLVGYYSSDQAGEIVYKSFFAEHSFVTSTAALITQSPSTFSIVALEDTELIKFPAKSYRQLVQSYPDLALFHMAYLEWNWVVKKEPLEITLKRDTAKQRYLQLAKEEALFKRLKQHQIASYLGITPTQLSRIRKALKKS